MATTLHQSGLKSPALKRPDGRTRALPRLLSVVAKLQTAFLVRRQRRALLALDDRMLADIGVSRSVAYREATRPFLDLPDRIA